MTSKVLRCLVATISHFPRTEGNLEPLPRNRYRPRVCSEACTQLQGREHQAMFWWVGNAWRSHHLKMWGLLWYWGFLHCWEDIYVPSKAGGEKQCKKQSAKEMPHRVFQELDEPSAGKSDARRYLETSKTRGIKVTCLSPGPNPHRERNASCSGLDCRAQNNQSHSWTVQIRYFIVFYL